MNSAQTFFRTILVLPLLCMSVQLPSLCAAEVVPYTFAQDRLTQLKKDFSLIEADELDDNDPEYGELVSLQFLDDLNRHAQSPEAKKGMMNTYQAFSRIAQYKVGNAFPLREILYSFFGDLHGALAGTIKTTVPQLIQSASAELMDINESLGDKALESTLIYDAFNNLEAALHKKVINTAWSIQKKIFVTLALIASAYALYKGAQGAHWTYKNRAHLGNYLQHLMYTLGQLHAHELARQGGKVGGRVLGHAYTFGSSALGAGWKGLTGGNLVSINGPGLNPLSWWRIPAKLSTRLSSMYLQVLAAHDPRVIELNAHAARELVTNATTGLESPPTRPAEFTKGVQ